MLAFRDYAWPSQQRTGQPSELNVYTAHWVNKSSPVPCLYPVDQLGQFGDVTRDPAARH